MKHATLLYSALLTTGLAAQTTVTVTTGPANNTQTWYSLQDGVQGSAPLAEWDIAFELTGITGGILANTAKGIEVYKAPFSLAQWADLDTAGLDLDWPAQHNSTTNWSAGAFNQGLTTNPFDLGWGIYNMITHNVTGDSLFVLKLANGNWKKLRIDAYTALTDAFTFTWADLDGSNEQSGSLQRAAFEEKNFGYVSLESNTVLDREPANGTWDLLFTKYLSFVPQPVPSYYPVAGVLQNVARPALRVDGIDPATFNDWTSAPMTEDIDVIGYDWKTFNMQTFQWEYAADRVHFVRDGDGNIWKLVFTAYGGSANGDITFTQELVSATSVEEGRNDGVLLTAYPNPVASGPLHLLISLPTDRAVARVIDLNGRVAFEEQFTGLGDLALRTIDVSRLEAGLYLVELRAGDTVLTQRFVVE